MGDPHAQVSHFPPSAVTPTVVMLAKTHLLPLIVPTLSSPPLSLLQLTNLVALADQDRTFNLYPHTSPAPPPPPPPSCMQLTTVVALASQDRTFSVWVCGETVPIVMSDERDKCFKQVCVWGGTGGGWMAGGGGGAGRPDGGEGPAPRCPTRSSIS